MVDLQLGEMVLEKSWIMSRAEKPEIATRLIGKNGMNSSEHYAGAKNEGEGSRLKASNFRSRPDLNYHFTFLGN